jgi:hypothetical protein
MFFLAACLAIAAVLVLVVGRMIPRDDHAGGIDGKVANGGKTVG